MSSSEKNYIACRVCDSVFLSTKALINHLDTHLVHEEDAARIRKHLQISHLMSFQSSNLFSNPLIQPGPATTALPFHPSPQIQPYFDHSRQFYSPVQAPPVPYLQRNPFDVPPNPNPYPSPQTYSLPARDLHAGFGSGFGAHSLLPSQQTSQLMVATEDSRDLRPFLSLLDYPIPQMNINCNGNSDELDLTLKL